MRGRPCQTVGRKKSGMGEITVLIIDDDALILELLNVNFELCGYKVAQCLGGQDALEMAAALKPSILIQQRNG